MINTNLTISGDVAGAPMGGGYAASGDTGIRVSATAPAAKAGTLSTRTDNTSGTLTLTAGHGIATGNTIDLYWTENGIAGKRRNVTVGTVAGTSVPISGGAGDNLPSQTTAVTCMKQVNLDVDFVGNNVAQAGAVLNGLTTGKRGTLQFFEGSTSRVTIDFTAGSPWIWTAGKGQGANPFASYAISSATLSHEDANASASCEIGLLMNATS